MSRDRVLGRDWADRLCESPIEAMLLRELVRHDLHIVPQAEIGPYRADLLVNGWLVVECDGHDFHSSREQRGSDAARDRWFLANDKVTVRFTGSQIYRDARQCASEVARLAAKRSTDAPAPSNRPQPEPLALPATPVKAHLYWHSEAPKTERLQAVRDELGDCQRCNLCRPNERTGEAPEPRRIVFGAGDPEADLVIVGEAPGAEENRLGVPFMGPAGALLDEMLDSVLGLRREQVYLLNVVKCRPPKNRNPLPDEIDACRPFLDAQIRAIAPRLLLVQGSVAYRTLFPTGVGITRARGQWTEHEGIPVMPTFHPAYLLRQPQDKRLTLDDLKQVRDRYDLNGGKR